MSGLGTSATAGLGRPGKSVRGFSATLTLSKMSSSASANTTTSLCVVVGQEESRGPKLLSPTLGDLQSFLPVSVRTELGGNACPRISVSLSSRESPVLATLPNTMCSGQSMPSTTLGLQTPITLLRMASLVSVAVLCLWLMLAAILVLNVMPPPKIKDECVFL
ncbi:unnamed protein product [Polarella glacialis]|uniref:Uncharacterized protein n=1 Tax=Polarella glacialis TaxID=89957 RepID=A0A813FQ77_POLGL|nr:unnamed protein product [Polarella glacialis]